MTLQEMNTLANSIRKHGQNRDTLIEDIAARLIPGFYRDTFKIKARG